MWIKRSEFRLRTKEREAGLEQADEGVSRGPEDRPRVPGMGRILLDERSQPEPMKATIVNRKA